MLHIKVLDDYVVSHTLIGRGAELNIVKRMISVAADDGFVAADIDTSVRAVKMILRILLESVHTDILVYYNCIWGIGFGIFFEVAEC